MTATTTQTAEPSPAEGGDTSPDEPGAWQTFRRNGVGMTGAIMLVVAIIIALFAPLLAPYDPYESVRVAIDDIYQAPSAAHLLGTDDGGKDVLSALLYGTRVSLIVGFAAAAISLLIGGFIGLVAGYYGHALETVLMRITDFFLVIPALVLQIVIVAIVGQSLRNIIIVIGVLGWTTTARLVRSQTLTVKQRRFVMRARALGAGDAHIIRRHVFPLVLPLMLANTVLVISLAILSESTLAFIGLGDPTVISWGQMLNFAFTRGAVTAGAWWALFGPGLALLWVVLSATLFGTALEDVFNPRLQRHHLEPELPQARRARARAHNHADEPVSDALLSVRNLSVEFETALGAARAVDDVSFDLRRGESLGLVGESGSGKTTSVLALLRLLPPGGSVAAGQVTFDELDVLTLPASDLRALRWQRLAIVFQGAMNALNPVRTVESQIAEAVRLHDDGVSRKAAAERAGDLLASVGITRSRAAEYAHTYSGGMRQRAMIALALACDPDIVVADEPTTALDVMVQAQILELLASLARERGMGMIMVTHDLGVVAATCDRVAVMYGGTIAEEGPTAEVFASPQHPYTRLLLEAFPDIDHPDRALSSIPGAPPRLTNQPSGCRFHPRCPDAMDRCTTERPPPYELDDGRLAACFLHDPATVGSGGGSGDG